MGQNIKTYYKPKSDVYSSSQRSTKDNTYETLEAHKKQRDLRTTRREEQSSTVGKIKSGVSRGVGRVKEWMEAHPSNRRERPERAEPREHSAPRNRTPTRVDRYQDGKVTETIYFGTDEKIPRRKAPRKAPRPRDSYGGFGSGVGMQDFIPSNLGLGAAMGYENPYAKSRKTKKKKPASSGDWTDPGYIPPELRGFF